MKQEEGIERTAVLGQAQIRWRQQDNMGELGPMQLERGDVTAVQPSLSGEMECRRRMKLELHENSGMVLTETALCGGCRNASDKIRCHQQPRSTKVNQGAK